MSRAAPRVLIVAACVLIDFYDADASVLTIISRALGPICVASPVLAEVEQLNESSARSLGLRVVHQAKLVSCSVLVRLVRFTPGELALFADFVQLEVARAGCRA